MMTPVEILEEAKQRGIVLEVQGDQVRFRAPRGSLTPDLLGTLRAYKAALLRLLTAKSHHATAARCGSPYCAGCYSVGVIDGRERFLHPPKGKPIDWAAWKPATEKLQ